MNRFSERAPCPKCGCTYVMVAYDSATGLLDRKCTRCGYVWHEKPLDATEPVVLTPQP